MLHFNQRRLDLIDFKVKVVTILTNFQLKACPKNMSHEIFSINTKLILSKWNNLPWPTNFSKNISKDGVVGMKFLCNGDDSQCFF